MAFHLPDSWVWDFWFADDGEHYHLFFLFASRALHDPEARHYRASVGHAISRDLVTWERVADALVRSDGPACDSLATWTGSTVQAPDGSWRMFYTGAEMVGDVNVQTIAMASSGDLLTWHKSDANPVLRADPRWYELVSDGVWRDEAFRDPWVFKDPNGDGWHMFITARGRTGESLDRGVVGHAFSADLETWELRPPLTDEGHGFGHLEVMQVEQVHSTNVMIFSAREVDVASRQLAPNQTTGTWAVPTEGPLGRFHLDEAYLLTDASLYSGRLIKRRDRDEWAYLAFHCDSPSGEFIGSISDPMPVTVRNGRLHIELPG